MAPFTNTLRRNRITLRCRNKGGHLGAPADDDRDAPHHCSGGNRLTDGSVQTSDDEEIAADTSSISIDRHPRRDVDGVELSKTLHRFASTMATTFDVDQVLAELCESATKILGVFGAGVAIEASGRLEFVTATDLRSFDIEQVQQKLQAGPCVEAFQTGEVYAVDDISVLAQWPEYLEAARDLGFVAMIGVPLLVGERRLGSMDVFSTEQRYWTANDLETVQILADVATAYLVHARRSVEAERLAAQAAASELRFRSLVEPSPDPVIRLGADGVVLAANRATHDLANINEHPAIGETLVGASVSELAVLHPALAAVAKQWPRLADITNPVAMERIEADSSGDRRHFRARFVPVGDHDEPGELLVVLTDVSADVEREALLERLALCDALTGLANRAAITDRLQVALGKLRRSDSDQDGVSAMVVDLDHFKAINDAFGPAAAMSWCVPSVVRSATRCVTSIRSVGWVATSSSSCAKRSPTKTSPRCWQRASLTRSIRWSSSSTVRPSTSPVRSGWRGRAIRSARELFSFEPIGRCCAPSSPWRAPRRTRQGRKWSRDGGGGVGA